MAIEYKTLVQKVYQFSFETPPYEYETEVIISRQAANGWELVSITPLALKNGSTSHLILVFKKPG